jgi:hypothetical protein
MHERLLTFCPDKRPQGFWQAVRPPLNADCSIHLTPSKSPQQDRHRASCRDELSVRFGLRCWTIRDLRAKLQQMQALWQSRRLPISSRGTML